MSPESPLSFDLAALAGIGWRPEFESSLPARAPGQTIARIVAQHRSGYVAHDGVDEFKVQAPAAMVRAGRDARERPAVGDWVVLDPGQLPLIATLLPRRTALTRAAAGERHAHQIIGANIDAVFLVTGLDGDFNPRRIERYLLLVHGTGATPVIVLTKRDRIDAAEADEKIAEARRVAGADGIVIALNAKDPASAALLAPYLEAGDTGVLVGSSGAGKSTLTNLLLGASTQKTAGVREHDSRGRHTTTHRALLPLPGGACLIDTPGMREIKLTGDEQVEEGQFADIAAIAASCRFRDCQHQREPGCAVRAAVDDGTLDADRLAHYFKLAGERDAARDQVAQRQRRKSDARVQDKALGKRLVDKYGTRGT